MLKDLVHKNRSYRRFYQDTPVALQTLRDLLDLARLTASGSNKQPLKYILCCQPETNARIYPNLAWAGYLKDWGGPAEGERPAAYIIILGDKEISTNFGVDHGIAAQTILLGAVEQGLGGCMIASIKRDALRETLNIPERFDILLALALGKPQEDIVITPLGADGDIRYYRDESGVHHVPKRALGDLIVEEYA